MKKTVDQLLETWKRERRTTTAPESLVAGEDCITMAETNSLVMKGEVLPAERVAHVNACPYCQRTIRLFEANKAPGTARKHGRPRVLAWVASLSVLSVAMCVLLFFATLPGVAPLNPGTPKGPTREDRLIPAATHWNLNRSLTISWNRAPDDVSVHRVTLISGNGEEVDVQNIRSPEHSYTVSWRNIPKAARLYYEVRAIPPPS